MHQDFPPWVCVGLPFASPPSACNNYSRHDLFVSNGPNPNQTYMPFGTSPFPPDTCLLLPIQTPSVTLEPSELHFYSGRHVRDRVRLHLRRVTENNNTENETKIRSSTHCTERERPRAWRKKPSGNEYRRAMAEARRNSANTTYLNKNL